jgi:hypothetical protein
MMTGWNSDYLERMRKKKMGGNAFGGTPINKPISGGPQNRQRPNLFGAGFLGGGMLPFNWPNSPTPQDRFNPRWRRLSIFS